jgi:hypothetical protein
VAPGAKATIGFHAEVALEHLGARLIDRADLTDQYGRRLVAWAVVQIPAKYHLPLIHK